MMNFLQNLFGWAAKTPAHKAIEPEVAAAALLVEAALADGIYADIESDQIAMILLESFDFDAARADAVLAQGEALAEEAVDATNSQNMSKHCPWNSVWPLSKGSISWPLPMAKNVPSKMRSSGKWQACCISRTSPERGLKNGHRRAPTPARTEQRDDKTIDKMPT